VQEQGQVVSNCEVGEPALGWVVKGVSGRNTGAIYQALVIAVRLLTSSFPDAALQGGGWG